MNYPCKSLPTPWGFQYFLISSYENTLRTLQRRTYNAPHLLNNLLLLLQQYIYLLETVYMIKNKLWGKVFFKKNNIIIKPKFQKKFANIWTLASFLLIYRVGSSFVKFSLKYFFYWFLKEYKMIAMFYRNNKTQLANDSKYKYNLKKRYLCHICTTIKTRYVVIFIGVKFTNR